MYIEFFNILIGANKIFLLSISTLRYYIIQNSYLHSKLVKFAKIYEKY